MLLGALQDNGGTQLQQVAEKALSSVGAEVPFAFKLAPGNMSRAVIATKIDPRTGETLPYSDTQIGLIGGVAGEGKPVHPFIFDDVKFAIGAIEAQQAVNLQLE